MNDDMKGLGKRRAGGILYLCTLFVGAMFAWIFIQSALEPEGQAFLRLTGRRVPLPWDEARLFFGIAGICMMAVIVWNAIITIRALWTLPRERAPAISLEAGESIRWRGQLGIASFSKERAIVAGLLALGLLPLAAALSWLWTREVQDLAFQLLLTGTFLLILGPMAFTGSWTAFFKRNRWLLELTGTLLITDRRLLWCGPDRKIRHELTTQELVDADLVEVENGRGWITLLCQGRGGTVSYELQGVPDAESAIAAIRRVIEDRWEITASAGAQSTGRCGLSLLRLRPDPSHG